MDFYIQGKGLPGPLSKTFLSGPLKIILIMKLTALLIVVMCFQVSAKVFSQEVSISVKNASIEKVLQEIRKQSGYTFCYNARYLKKAEPVTMKVEKASLEEALESCFSGQPFTYEIIGNAIV